VTLREDIHSSIDEIAPPAPALAGRIAYLAAEARLEAGHARPLWRGRWMAGLGRSGSLVAAILIVLIMASLVVGVRAWRDRNLFIEGPTAPTIDPAALAQLEARPLHLPLRPLGAECQVGPWATVDTGRGPAVAIGVDPAYVRGDWHAATATRWGTYSDWLIFTDPNLTGLVLVRGGDLEVNLPVVFVGPHAAGSVVGTDTIAGKTVQQHSEAVFDAGHHDPVTSGTGKWGIWPMSPGIDKAESGCIAFQIDGPTFSEIVVSVDVPTDHHH
jgi:hypothetical protein